MLPPDGESDRFMTAKVLNLVGCRREKYVFCYVPVIEDEMALSFTPSGSVKLNQNITKWPFLLFSWRS